MRHHESVCPIPTVAKLLSDTWTILIMHELISGPKRFCELERSLAGISTRTLALKLKKLHQENLLQKNKTGHYEATEKGKGLQIIEKAMKTYSVRYLT